MEKIKGFIVAPFTPMNSDGSLNLKLVAPYAEMVVRNGLTGVFVNGSTGEGALMTREERNAHTEEWIKQSAGRLKVIVHVGQASIEDQKAMAAHAAEHGAFGFATMAPSFLPARRIEDLVAYMKEIAAAAPNLPFYYYHIPGLSGVNNMPIVPLLKAVDGVIPNFAGVKYTADNAYEACQAKLYAGGKYEILHGLDETLLTALAYGLRDGGVGGTYNHIFPVYKALVEAWDSGNIEEARRLQLVSQEFINILPLYRGNMGAGKRIMKFLGLDLGPNRLPLQSITDQEEKEIKAYLDSIGFSKICNK
ncbi:MAG: dihydrodipicolinate synthase family protein [Mucinivorans sp.]